MTVTRRFDLPMEDLEQATPFESTTDYLATLKAAHQSYPVLVATLTPCAVGYAEIACALDAQGTCSEPDYAAWVKTYMDPTFQDTVHVFEEELDRCGEQEDVLPAIEEAYKRAACCELAFNSP